MSNTGENLKNNELAEEQSFNWKLFLTIGWITRWWVVLYIVLAIVASFLISRYSTPLYLSQADVQFKDKSKENTFDLGILVSNTNVDRLNEEMTILKSKGYKLDALKQLPIQVSYFIKENVKEGEIYKGSPYEIKVEIIDSSIIGQKITVAIIDTNYFSLKYLYDHEDLDYKFEFDKPYSTPAFNITAHLVRKEKTNRFFFVQ